VDDLEKHRVFEFICNRWLAEDEDDGKTTLFLYPTVNNNAPEPEKGVPYTINVHTGDVKNASTSANVFIELFGGKTGDKSSGRIKLDGEFKSGKIDKIKIDSPEMLSPLSEILIGHDNTGAGPGWFLDKIEIECHSIGLKQVFPCKKWLAKDEGDGRIERILKENTSLRESHRAETIWHVWVYTSDLKNAGTDASVSMTLYGDKGKTDEIPLNNKSDNFESGKCDKFKIETNDIGQPFKLRIQHDNKGLASGWHLDHIEIENMQSKERFYFNCKRWLSKDEDDREIVRELPAENEELISRPLPVVTYLVDVQTGNKTSAGTNANVFLNIFGEFGDTGDRWLNKSETHKDKFERNQLDVFRVEAVQLRKIKKIRIGHDGNGVGDGWFLKSVTIRQEGTEKYNQTFECNRWLAKDEDDGLIVRELLAAGGSQFLDKTSYHVKIKTGDKVSAGTDADVHIKIYGEKGDTGTVRLEYSDNTSNKFERGRVDDFKIENEDLGKIEKIKIGHNGKGIGSGW
jgi:lipoxygenase homology domain-containing protein 1